MKAQLQILNESAYSTTVTNNGWYFTGTTADPLTFRSKGFTPIVKDTRCLQRQHEIGMPQMANRGLSENWLLKELGDMHWNMLTKGLEQRSSDLFDAQGNRLYAAFVRINYAISPLSAFRENGMLELRGGMKRFGDYAYYSSIKGAGDGNSIQANLMSSFSFRQANDNARITRGMLANSINNIDELAANPAFYDEHRAVNKRKLDVLYTGGYTFRISDKILATETHDINPHYEINGVGLLYFAVYPIIADRCASAFFKNALDMKDYDQEYHTIFRDAFYFGNCNANDRLYMHLNSAEAISDNKIAMSVSIFRESDNKLIARVFTVKQKA